MSTERQGWFSGLLTDLAVWVLCVVMLVGLTLIFPLILLLNFVRRVRGQAPIWKSSEMKSEIPRRFLGDRQSYRNN